MSRNVAATAAVNPTVVAIAIRELHPAADNLRVALGDLTELEASIVSQGILDPLIVTPRAKGGASALDGYTIVAGHRRFAAAQALKHVTVPAIVRELTERQRVEVMLVENLQREDLVPLEEADAFRRLMELGLGQVEVAKRIGRSQAHVSKRLALLKLPDVARTAIVAGKLPLADALELAHYAAEPEVITKVLAQGFYPGNAGRLAESVKHTLDQDRKRQAALDQLAAAQVSIITSDGWSPKGETYSLERGAWGGLPIGVTAHAKHPCHAAWVDADARIRYVCTKPSNHLKDANKAIAKAAKQLTSKGGKSNTTKAGKDAQAKAAETRERNKALRVAAPIRRKLAGQLLKPSKVRRESLEFALRQLIQTALDKSPAAGRIAAELLGVKATDRDGDPSFRSFAGAPAKVDQLAYALGLALGEISFGTLDSRNYFDEEFAAHAARYFAHLKTAGSYKATPTELAQIKPSGWRPSWEGAAK